MQGMKPRERERGRASERAWLDASAYLAHTDSELPTLERLVQCYPHVFIEVDCHGAARAVLVMVSPTLTPRVQVPT